ncbi:MAG TPA: DUF72 domain-containing protein, partial [Capsulimonadaceae bacterium]|nr:DUF72 domain-containing protein [Capsulimonadaceae bacterium]
MASRIKIGTASWQDPGFIQDWYPKDLPKSQLLPWYAEHFPYVEVNSTFYHVPEPRTLEHWARQTPGNFTFDLKLHKLLSHHSTKPDDLPEELRYLVAETAKRVERTPELEQALLRLTLDAVAPLASAGKLGAFLLQMSPSFRPKYHSLDELLPVRESLVGTPLALELRNRDWISAEIAPKVFDFCEDHAITLVMVDAPETSHFMALPEFEAVTNPKLAYLRLHGRNAEGYVRGRSVAERFKYDYSEEELEEVAVKIERIAKEAAEVHVAFNNNFSNYAPK